MLALRSEFTVFIMLESMIAFPMREEPTIAVMMAAKRPTRRILGNRKFSLEPSRLTISLH